MNAVSLSSERNSIMDYFLIFIQTRGRKIVFVGGTEDIGHKLILLGKSSAHRHVYGDVSDPRISALITSGEVTQHARALSPEDTKDAVFAYIGTDDVAQRHAAMAVLDAAAIPADLAQRMPENEWLEAAAHALPSYQMRFLYG